jgi:hypothetical protein
MNYKLKLHSLNCKNVVTDHGNISIYGAFNALTRRGFNCIWDSDKNGFSVLREEQFLTYWAYMA